MPPMANRRVRPRPLALLALVALPPVLAACGPGGSSVSGTPSSTSAPTTTSTTTSSTGPGTSTSTSTTGSGGGPTGGSVSATVTPPSGTAVVVTAGTVTCTMSSPVTIIITAVGKDAAGDTVTIKAGAEGAYTGPGTYSFAEAGPLGSVAVGTVTGGMFSTGQLVVAPGARSATVTAQYQDEKAALAGAQNFTGSVQAALSWSSCPSPN